MTKRTSFTTNSTEGDGVTVPRPTDTVYSFYYPEVRNIVEELWANRPHSLYEEAYTKKQDAYHRVLLELYRSWVDHRISIPAPFHGYYTSGSNEAIRCLVARLGQTDSGRMFVFRGEYEGYEAYAQAYGVPVVKIDRDQYPYQLGRYSPGAGDEFYISQPSSIDGNIWGDDQFAFFVSWVQSQYPKLSIKLDLAYVGCTPRVPSIEISGTPIDTVFWSLSKAFGVFYHRIGGVFSESQLPELEGNVWFKNMFSIALAKRLLGFPPTYLPSFWRDRQLEAIHRLREEYAWFDASDPEPSDVILLAHGRSNPPAFDLTDYTRDNDIPRYCLTPVLDD